MVCKYLLTFGAGEKAVEVEIPRTDLKNWDDMEYRIKRMEYSGLVRSFSSAFEFVGKTADMLTDEFMKNKLYSLVTIEVKGLRNDRLYTTLFSCPLDFSSYEREDGVVRLNAIDNSLAAYIKTNKGKKYEYNMAKDFERKKPSVPPGGDPAVKGDSMWGGSEWEREKKDNRMFIYESMDMDSVVFYEVGNRVDGEVYRELNFADNKLYQCVPIENIGDDILDEEYNEWSSQEAEQLKLLTKEELQALGADIPVSLAFPYGIVSSTTNSVLHNTIDLVDKFVTVYVHIAFELKSEIKIPENVEFYVCTARTVTSETDGEQAAVYNITGENGIVGYWKIPYIQDDKLAEKGIYRYQLDEQFSMYDGFYMKVIAKLKEPVKNVKSKVTSSSFSVKWKTRKDPSRIDYVTPFQLLENLIHSMTEKSGKKYKCKINISNYASIPGNYIGLGHSSNDEWRLMRTIIVPYDAIARNPDKTRYIKTSFSDFCKWMEAVFGYVWRVEVIEGVETIVFKHRRDILSTSPSSRNYPNYFDSVNDVKYKVGKRANVSVVQMGYDCKDDNYNYRYEFNKRMDYDTGIVNTDKKQSFISPYRADCIGFELIYRDGLKKAQDEKTSHDGIWCVYSPYDKATSLPRTAGYMSTVGQDYYHNGLFNYYLSPVFNLKANSCLLAGLFNKLLLLNKLDTNNFLVSVTGGKEHSLISKSDWVSKKNDKGEEIGPFLFFKWKDIGVGDITFKTSYIFPVDYDSIFTIEWQGKTFRGYVNEIKNKFERVESSECTMLELQIDDKI